MHLNPNYAVALQDAKNTCTLLKCPTAAFALAPAAEVGFIQLNLAGQQLRGIAAVRQQGCS
jgi:hypothetical protein